MNQLTSQAQSFETKPLVAIKAVGRGIYSLDFDWTGSEPLAGQFFMLRPARSAVLLGRPISVFNWDLPAGRLRFLICQTGSGTQELTSLQPGDLVELNGPIGSAWPPDFKLPGLALVGGGVGIAPLYFLAQQLPAENYDFYAGFSSEQFGLDGLKPRQLIITTEDGSNGLKGRILDYFTAANYQAVCACGPEIMLRLVAETCIQAKVACWLSLERRMACAVGACLGCTVRTRQGNRRCCVDGPIFKAEELLFDD